MTLSETHIVDGQYDDNESLFQILKGIVKMEQVEGLLCLLKITLGGKGNTT
jgi:hypothetical protein